MTLAILQRERLGIDVLRDLFERLRPRGVTGHRHRFFRSDLCRGQTGFPPVRVRVKQQRAREREQSSCECQESFHSTISNPCASNWLLLVREGDGFRGQTIDTIG